MTHPHGHAFPPARRLTRRSDFLLVYERGVRVPGDHIVLFAMPGSAPHARLGLTATRKVGNAVVRNRARRLLREAFRRNRHAFDAWDMVVNIRASAASRSASQIEAELLALAQRALRALARRGQQPQAGREDPQA